MEYLWIPAALMATTLVSFIVGLAYMPSSVRRRRRRRRRRR